MFQTLIFTTQQLYLITKKHSTSVCACVTPGDLVALQRDRFFNMQEKLKLTPELNPRQRSHEETSWSCHTSDLTSTLMCLMVIFTPCKGAKEEAIGRHHWFRGWGFLSRSFDMPTMPEKHTVTWTREWKQSCNFCRFEDYYWPLWQLRESANVALSWCS